MKTYTITKENYINWFFNSGSDQEQEATRKDLGDRLVERLLSGEDFFYSVDDAFNEVDVEVIPLSYLEEFNDDDDREVGDLEEIIDLILID